jgi:hypothetical protein
LHTPSNPPPTLHSWRPSIAPSKRGTHHFFLFPLPPPDQPPDLDHPARPMSSTRRRRRGVGVRGLHVGEVTHHPVGGEVLQRGRRGSELLAVLRRTRSGSRCVTQPRHLALRQATTSTCSAAAPRTSPPAPGRQVARSWGR